MTMLLHASDPHFGTEQPAAVDALVQLVHEQRPDVLLLSGDITQRATATQFDRARAFVSRLQVPVILAIPGNHDIPLFNVMARMIAPYARYRHAFGRDLEPEFENDDVLVIALNTTRRYRHVDAVARTNRARGTSARTGPPGAMAHDRHAPSGGRDACARPPQLAERSRSGGAALGCGGCGFDTRRTYPSTVFHAPTRTLAAIIAGRVGTAGRHRCQLTGARRRWQFGQHHPTRRNGRDPRLKCRRPTPLRR